jgi:hypothetical protein
MFTGSPDLACLSFGADRVQVQIDHCLSTITDAARSPQLL